MKIQGKLIEKSGITEVKLEHRRAFKARRIIIRCVEFDGGFVQDVPLELYNSRCALADKYELGENIEAIVKLRVRKLIKDEKPIYYLRLVVLGLDAPGTAAETLDGRLSALMPTSNNIQK